jgi:hypothetical protein
LDPERQLVNALASGVAAVGRVPTSEEGSASALENGAGPHALELALRSTDHIADATLLTA